MMKFSIVAILFLLLTGCSLIQLTPDPAREKQQKKFVIAFDKYVARDDISGLQQYIRDYPDSLWSVRAAAVVRQLQDARQLQEQLQEQLAQQQAATGKERVRLQQEQQQDVAALQQLREEKKRLSRDLEQQAAQLKQLEQQNLQLNEQLEKLKTLLIEQELRPQ